MFVAGRMFADAKEAKDWVEANVLEAERRHWMVLQLEGNEMEETGAVTQVEGSVIPSKEKP